MKLWEWLIEHLGLTVSIASPPPRAKPEPIIRELTSTLYRFHSAEHFRPESLWESFLDGPWKWDAQERFAGAQLNCGHFFARDREGARSETAFYGLDKAGSLWSWRFNSIKSLT